MQTDPKPKTASKKGYLRYKCSACSGLVRVEVNDLYHALDYGSSRYLKPVFHQCDATHVNLAPFIGGTYYEEQDLDLHNLQNQGL